MSVQAPAATGTERPLPPPPRKGSTRAGVSSPMAGRSAAGGTGAEQFTATANDRVTTLTIARRAAAACEASPMDDKVNLAEKLALLDAPYRPGIVGYLNDYKLAVVK